MIVRHKYGRLRHKIHQEIIKQKSRLKLFKYDDLTTELIEQKISDDYELIRMLDRENPMTKIHEYGGEWKCPKCECIINKYARYCHYCGQAFVVPKDDSLLGWCPDK